MEYGYGWFKALQINMLQPEQLVQWPAIIKLHADNELIFISDEVQFASKAKQQLTHVQTRDRLIDSSGATYSINHGQDPELVCTGLSLPLPDIEVLLRLHLSSNGNCCVSKFHAHSIQEAFMAVFAGDAIYHVNPIA